MRLWPVPVMVLLASPVMAHEGKHGLDEQLVEDGHRLMLGSFNSPQPGPLVVLPHVAGPLACDGSGAWFRAGLEAGTALALSLNETDLVATFVLPTGARGYVSFALDSNAAARTLILMKEHATSLHRLGALVSDEAGTRMRNGTMGVPYALPVESPHDIDHGNPDGGVLLDYEPVGGVAQCGNTTSVAFDRSSLSSLASGSVVHAVALFDPVLPHFLPRPIEESTRVVQLNLYLARPGEDPDEVARALDPTAGPSEWLPLAALGGGAFFLAMTLGPDHAGGARPPGKGAARRRRLK